MLNCHFNYTFPCVEWIVIWIWINLNFKILTNLASESRPRFNFISSTKHQQQNTDKTSAPKSHLSFNFKILTKPCAQSLNNNLSSQTNSSFQICTKMSSTRFLASTSTTVTISTSFELIFSHARITSIKFTKQQLVS